MERTQTLGGGEFGGALSCAGERNSYVREFRRRKWFVGPYAPLLVDTGAARERWVHEARLETDAAELREFRDANVIDLLEIDDAF